MHWTRREVVKLGTLALAGKSVGLQAEVLDRRPAPADRKFTSEGVERYIAETAKRIADPELRQLFINCFPNTLDTTVQPGTADGKPDTVVLTGDIPAMWLRDSSAQVWPYVPLAKQDEKLRALLEGAS